MYIILFTMESMIVFFTATWRWRQCTQQCGWQWGAQPCVSCSSRCGHGWSKGGEETYFQGSRLSGAWEFILFLQGTKPHIGKWFVGLALIVTAFLSFSHYFTPLCIFIFVVRFEVLTLVFTEDLSPLECYALLIGK